MLEMLRRAAGNSQSPEFTIMDNAIVIGFKTPVSVEVELQRQPPHPGTCGKWASHLP